MNLPPSSGELAAIATIVGPSACASRTRAAQSACGPASRLTCTDAVDVIIAAPAAPVWLAAKNCSIARYRSPGFTRFAGRSGSAPSSTRPNPASANAERSTARSAAMAVIAGSRPSIGGPDSSTAPPGSTVIDAAAGQVGHICDDRGDLVPIPGGAADRRDRRSAPRLSRPTRPTGPSVRQLAPMCSAALLALVSSASSTSIGCASSRSDVMALVITTIPSGSGTLAAFTPSSRRHRQSPAIFA